MKVGLTELIQDYCAKSVPKIANKSFQSFVYIIAEQKAPISSNLERLRFSFTPYSRREFVPRDQVFPLFSVYSLLLLHKNK